MLLFWLGSFIYLIPSIFPNSHQFHGKILIGGDGMRPWYDNFGSLIICSHLDLMTLWIPLTSVRISTHKIDPEWEVIKEVVCFVGFFYRSRRRSSLPFPFPFEDARIRPEGDAWSGEPAWALFITFCYNFMLMGAAEMRRGSFCDGSFIVQQWKLKPLTFASWERERATFLKSLSLLIISTLFRR